jgi:hypothetical protein
MKLKNMKTFEEHSSELNISDVRERILDYIEKRIIKINSKNNYSDENLARIDELRDLKTEIDRISSNNNYFDDDEDGM